MNGQASERTAAADGRGGGGGDHHPAEQHHQHRQQRRQLLQLLHHPVQHHRCGRDHHRRARRTGARSSVWLSQLRGAATLYMAITGMIFSLLLSGADVQTPIPWVNSTLHYVFPLFIVIDWLVDRSVRPLSFKQGLIFLVVSGRLRHLQPDPRADRRLVPVPVPGSADERLHLCRRDDGLRRDRRIGTGLAALLGIPVGPRPAGAANRAGRRRSLNEPAARASHPSSRLRESGGPGGPSRIHRQARRAVMSRRDQRYRARGRWDDIVRRTVGRRAGGARRWAGHAARGARSRPVVGVVVGQAAGRATGRDHRRPSGVLRGRRPGRNHRVVSGLVRGIRPARTRSQPIGRVTPPIRPVGQAGRNRSGSGRRIHADAAVGGGFGRALRRRARRRLGIPR